MNTATHPVTPGDVERRSPRTHAGLLALLLFGALAAVYWPTLASIEAIWRRSPTFAHGYLVVPIALWLIWQHRRELGSLTPAPFWPAVGLVAAGGAAWMLGSLAGVTALAQFSLYLMMLGAALTVLGLAICGEIAFALAFLAFAVPLGEFLVPWLIDRTADFTLLALEASRVPVFREGNDLIIPSGRWSVVDACSGIRYLIASVMVGTLYAHFCYRSLRKRLVFLGASIVVPIVANWLRAYIIVMLGHLTNNRLATGVDHFIYGWVFFGIVMLLMFWIGSFWRDANVGPDRTPAGASLTPATAGSGATRVALAAGAVMIAAFVWRPLTAAIDARPEAGRARPLASIAPTAGWHEAPPISPIWTPHFEGSRSQLQQWFAHGDGTVGIFLAFYAGQSRGHELIEYRNDLVVTDDKTWKQTGSGRAEVRWGDDVIAVNTADLVAAGQQLTARAWYWVDGRHTPSAGVAKALLARSRLLQRPDYSALIVIYTGHDEGGARRDAELLDRFSADMAAPIMQALHTATAAQ